jgi:hypothetical protein
MHSNSIYSARIFSEADYLNFLLFRVKHAISAYAHKLFIVFNNQLALIRNNSSAEAIPFFEKKMP